MNILLKNKKKKKKQKQKEKKKKKKKLKEVVLNQGVMIKIYICIWIKCIKYIFNYIKFISFFF